jgi:general secretion pathway protein J
MTRRSRWASQRGLTLLEVLVAVGILALVATLIYGAFDGMQRARTGIARIDDRYHQGRQALVRMSRELQSAFLSAHQPQLLTASLRTTIFLGTDGGSSDRVDFTSFSHQRLMRNKHESDQNELSYFLGRDPDRGDKYDLLRREQREIDLDPTKGGVVSVLCEDATIFDVQYLEPLTDTWLDAWDSSQPSNQYQFNRLPFQVRIKLVLRGGEGDRPIKLMTKVSLGLQAPLTFAYPKSAVQQAQNQQQGTPGQ